MTNPFYFPNCTIFLDLFIVAGICNTISKQLIPLPLLTTLFCFCMRRTLDFVYTPSRTGTKSLVNEHLSEATNSILLGLHETNFILAARVPVAFNEFHIYLSS